MNLEIDKLYPTAEKPKSVFDVSVNQLITAIILYTVFWGTYKISPIPFIIPDVVAVLLLGIVASIIAFWGGKR